MELLEEKMVIENNLFIKDFFEERTVKNIIAEIDKEIKWMIDTQDYISYAIVTFFGKEHLMGEFLETLKEVDSVLSNAYLESLNYDEYIYFNTKCIAAPSEEVVYTNIVKRFKTLLDEDKWWEGEKDKITELIESIKSVYLC